MIVNRKTAIVVLGTISSGKSTVAKAIRDHARIPLASFGAYLLEYCKSHGLGSERKTLQDIGEKFLAETPIQFLNDVISFAGPSAEILVIDGVRHRVILDAIKHSFLKTFVIYLDISYSVRFERFMQRSKGTDITLNEEAFKTMNAHPVEREVTALKSVADFVVSDVTPSDSIIEQVHAFIKTNE